MELHSGAPAHQGPDAPGGLRRQPILPYQPHDGHQFTCASIVPGPAGMHKRRRSCRGPEGRVPQGAAYLPPGTRPNPYVSNNTAWIDQGTASYHALNVSLQKRVTHRLAFKANYTYSKVIDLNSAILAPSGENEPADVFSPYNLSLNRGPASFSLHHQFSTNFSYQMPFGRGQRFAGGAGGWKNQLIGGWQWNGIVTAQGGFPLTPLIGFNNSGTGDTNVTDVPSWNPNFIGPAVLGT